MAKEKSKYRQVHQYDKVLRENLETVLPGLIPKVLGIHVIKSEELPDDIQHTKERHPDVLKKITDKTGETYVLHIEFQVKDEPEMVFRMAEYFVMLWRKYRIGVRQYVIYLGEGKPGMPVHFRQRQMNFHYELIVFSEIDYQLLLSAKDPKLKMLAVLGNFKGQPNKLVVRDIAKQIMETSKGDFAVRRNLKQLDILMQMRNLGVGNFGKMDSIGTFVHEKTLTYAIGQSDGIEKGMQKGIKKIKEQLVRKLLLKTDFSIAKIADLAEVSEYLVRKIKKSLH